MSESKEIRLRKLEGYESYQAFVAFHRLLYGIKMLPHYEGETYPEFFKRINSMSEDEQRMIFSEALSFVLLTPEEIQALAFFGEDQNGVQYHAANIKNTPFSRIVEVAAEVCIAFGKIPPPHFVSAYEKKK